MWFNKLNKKIILLTRQRANKSLPFRAYSRRVILVAYTAASGILYSLITLFIADNAFNNWVALFINLDFIALCIIALLLLLNGKVAAGKTLFVVSAIVSYFFYANTNTYYAGMQYGWFMLLFLIFASYSIIEKKPLIICLLTLVISILICEFTDYELLAVSNLNISGAKFHNTWFLYLNIITTGIFLYFLSANFYFSYREKERTNEFLTLQTKKLLKANRDLDKFVYHAAHDIRAPITSMLGLISLGKTENDLTRVRSFFKMQEKTILQLDSYVEQILSVSRVKNSKDHPELIDLKELEILLKNQSHFMFKAKEMKINFVFDLTTPFYSNKLTLQTIINNLLSNSIKYADSNKKESFVDVKFSNSNTFLNGLKVEVLDNGIGIHTEDISRVTDIFFYNKVMNKGTGYGLYIVKEAVDNLEGDINFESELGSHTNVVIDLPNMKSDLQDAE